MRRNYLSCFVFHGFQGVDDPGQKDDISICMRIMRLLLLVSDCSIHWNEIVMNVK